MMDKIIGYKEEDIKQKFDWMMSNIRGISEMLVVISQQLDGKRDNLDSDYAKEAYHKLENVVNLLDNFYKTDRLSPFKKAKRDLENKIKEEIF
jgi:flagellar motor switch protein FliG